MSATKLVALLSCVVGAMLLLVVPAAAGNEVNYQDPLTAAPPIVRPPTPSCTTTVMQDFAFNSSIGQASSTGP
jgi:hypothetical protein